MKLPCYMFTLCIISLSQVTNTSAIFEGKQCDSEHHTLHSEWKIALFHEYVVENLKYVVPGIFFSREISHVFRRNFTPSVRMFFEGLK